MPYYKTSDGKLNAERAGCSTCFGCGDCSKDPVEDYETYSAEKEIYLNEIRENEELQKIIGNFKAGSVILAGYKSMEDLQLKRKLRKVALEEEAIKIENAEKEIKETILGITKINSHGKIGVFIKTNKQFITLDITSHRYDGEVFGCLASCGYRDGDYRFIVGSNLKSIKQSYLFVQDTQFHKHTKKLAHESHFNCNNTVFVEIETSNGVLTTFFYNLQNGYNSHIVEVNSDSLRGKLSI